jgi:hypothetical protein
MFLTKLVLSSLILLSIAQAKPVINGQNIKAYIDSVKIPVMVGGKYVSYSLYAEGFASANGVVRLVHPKLYLDKSHYGIELSPTVSTSSAHYQAVAGIASIICGKMGRQVLTKNGMLDTAVYPSLFQSMYIEVGSAGALLVFRGTIHDSKNKIMNSITCI